MARITTHLGAPKDCNNSREASVRFGSRFGGGTVRAVPVFGSGGSSAKWVFLSFQHSLTGKDGSGSGFGSWKTVPAVPVPLSVSGKTVPTVPVPGSGSVPEPPCNRVAKRGAVEAAEDEAVRQLASALGHRHRPGE